MGKLFMVAGGVVEPSAGKPGAVSAYVVLSAGRMSRIFKVEGPRDAAVVKELAAATTVDMKRFQTELAQDLAAAAPGAAVQRPDDKWVTGLVAAYLKKSEGLDVE
jgi:hypothetical protein